MPDATERAVLPYVLLGAAADAERRSRAALSAGARAVSVAAWPAAMAWRSPLGAPLRRRAGEASTAFGDEGRELVRRGSTQVRATGARLMRRLGEELVYSGLADELVDRLLSSGAFDRVVTVVINHPATEALVASALDDPGLDRLIARVMDSRLIDELTARLLESDEMRLVLDYVTRSPELRAALAHQTAGLADDVAAGMRTRTAVADVAAENFARRLIGRRHRPAIE